MRRRQFILAVGATTSLAVAGHTQQSKRVRRVGVLFQFPENDPLAQAMARAFALGLARLGWVEGKNLTLDYRFAANDPALLDADAAELVALAPDALLASIPLAVSALQKRTSTIPIVFTLVAAPVQQGFVQSLARPGGNITGFTSFEPPMTAKWLQLLKEVAPAVQRAAIIFNPDTAPYAKLLNPVIEAAAPSLGVTVTLAPVHDDEAIEECVATQAGEPGGGLISLPDSFTAAHRATIIAAAARHRMPLIGASEFFSKSGALMSYFIDPVETHAQAASYIDRILRGARPSELPVQEPTKYSLIINLKTAKTLGLTVPPALLARADEVIE